MMLARIVKLNCENYDVTKQLLIWILKDKKKFCTSRAENFPQDEFDEFNEFNEKRRDSYYGKGYNSKYGNKFQNRKFGNRYENRGQFRFGKLSNPSFACKSAIDWDSVNLKPFKKEFYKPHLDVLNRSPEEVKEFHRNNDIQVFGKDCPSPILKFDELDLPKELFDYLSCFNYSEPTPIQSQTWPIALSGRDLVGISRTGSGKTLGFVLPAIVHIQNQLALEKNEGPIALILAPTRELVQQIQDVTDPIARACRMQTASLFGGTSKRIQMNEIMSKKEIYVATPGRLLDFLNDRITNLMRCTYLVLDEADQMLNMGFEPQIRSIISNIRPDRQVLMWSATWPREIRNLANEFLKDYIKIQVGSSELTANPNIIQVVHVCNEENKLDLLQEILDKIRKEPECKTLIFAQTKYGVEKIGRFLMSKGIRARTLHGDHSQALRNKVMNSFRMGQSQILVATNVAGRGLDVSDIKFVINFDFPQTVEEYIHKIGRTARSNNSGTAYTFFTPENAGQAQDLISVLENTNQIVSSELKELVYGRYSHSGSKFRPGVRY